MCLSSQQLKSAWYIDKIRETFDKWDNRFVPINEEVWCDESDSEKELKDFVKRAFAL